MKYALAHPFKRDPMIGAGFIGGVTVEVIEFRHPTAFDFFGLNFSEPEKASENMAILLTKISDLKLSEVKNLHIEDFIALSHLIGDIISGKRK